MEVRSRVDAFAFTRSYESSIGSKQSRQSGTTKEQRHLVWCICVPSTREREATKGICCSNVERSTMLCRIYGTWSPDAIGANRERLFPVSFSILLSDHSRSYLSVASFGFAAKKSDSVCCCMCGSLYLFFLPDSNALCWIASRTSTQPNRL